MSDADTPAILPKDDPKFSVALLVPFLGLIAIVVVCARNMGPPTMDWAGISIVAPIDASTQYRIGDDAFFEVKSNRNVRAAFSGKVDVVSERELTITSLSDPVLIANYYGIVSISVKEQQEVKSGETIAQLQAGRPEFGRLRLRLLRSNELLTPPFSERFSDMGQTISALACNGCHQLRGIIPIVDKKMRDGRPATAKAVAESIRHGGKVKGPFGMPPFDAAALSDAELEAVTRWMCAKNCVQ